ncbi:UNVERIFIED_CONTAM: hypothetical protein PYX00_003021 [Menopon gallinae]|uniref:Uncharacterized protein n=1 Tax=Menopon gallinae TaxID=328185 RepID=A0AAW2HZ90_9NEOP
MHCPDLPPHLTDLGLDFRAEIREGSSLVVQNVGLDVVESLIQSRVQTLCLQLYQVSHFQKYLVNSVLDPPLRVEDVVRGLDHHLLDFRQTLDLLQQLLVTPADVRIQIFTQRLYIRQILDDVLLAVIHSRDAFVDLHRDFRHGLIVDRHQFFLHFLQTFLRDVVQFLQIRFARQSRDFLRAPRVYLQQLLQLLLLLLNQSGQLILPLGALGLRLARFLQHFLHDPLGLEDRFFQLLVQFDGIRLDDRFLRRNLRLNLHQQ